VLKACPAVVAILVSDQHKKTETSEISNILFFETNYNEVTEPKL
jgi:hypothetical protein